MEIARCIRSQKGIEETIDTILLATNKYNNTIHSVTKSKPIDTVHISNLDNIEIIKAIISDAH